MATIEGVIPPAGDEKKFFDEAVKALAPLSLREQFSQMLKGKGLNDVENYKKWIDAHIGFMVYYFAYQVARADEIRLVPDHPGPYQRRARAIMKPNLQTTEGKLEAKVMEHLVGVEEGYVKGPDHYPRGAIDSLAENIFHLYRVYSRSSETPDNDGIGSPETRFRLGFYTYLVAYADEL